MFIAVGKATLFIRSSQSLKDKRQVLQSIIQKLRNLGFSATECDHHDNLKQALIGFSYVAKSYPTAQEKLTAGFNILNGDFLVASFSKKIFDFSEENVMSLRDFNLYSDQS